MSLTDRYAQDSADKQDANEYRKMIREAETKNTAKGAYDKGRIDTEEGLARMLYEQVMQPQGALMPEQPVDPLMGRMTTPREELPMNVDPSKLSYREAKLLGYAR